MYITKYRPRRRMRGILRDFDRLSSLMEELVEESGLVGENDFVPSANTRESEEAYHIELDLPGIKKEDIEVSIDENILTISGERKTETEIKEEDYYKIESSYGTFKRSFTLPENADIDNIDAESEDGVLEVVIPKRPEEKDKPKKIAIK